MLLNFGPYETGKITKIRLLKCFVADDVMYAADNLEGRILAINLTTSSVTIVYRARDNLRPYTVAVNQQYIYFSAWNRKFVCAFLPLDCCNVCCVVVSGSKTLLCFLRSNCHFFLPRPEKISLKTIKYNSNSKPFK